MKIDVIHADYLNKLHAAHISELLNIYAMDPMGGGVPLREEVKKNVVKALAARPYALSVLAYSGSKPVGLANCFEMFSTFSCKSVLNIHDFMVVEAFRGQGISQRLLEEVEEIAKSKGCCKITLEVLSGNEVAKAAYRKFGFAGYELDPSAGSALFWQKTF